MKRMTARTWLIAATLPLAACSGASQHDQASRMAAFDVAEKAPGRAEADAPQIAYSYAVEYTLSGVAVGPVQSGHVAACRGMGRDRCTVLETTFRRVDGGGGSGTTRLLVDARAAGAFGQRLDGSVRQAGGTLESRSVTAEDVTRQIVDTEARLRAKQALADRLLRLIEGGRAGTGDLVAAEKAYADVQQDLDAARTTQRQLRRRVALSQVSLTYNAARPHGVWAPVVTAFGSGAETFAASVGAAITFVIAAAPWLVIVGPFFWLLRSAWRRWRARRRAAKA